ncbi:MAG: NERD domain-containing protein [Clostridiales bacterium]|nr:NERD domain-containing protein [Clostridiales bacterium]
MRDTGMLGEYMTYRELKTYEADNGKFLFNLYIPKGDDATTEIDLILICSKGIFVFESKNYSGWIFGNENQSRWCQTLPNGKGRSQKEYFYNPIMQNRTHIKKLEALLSEDSQIYDAKVPVYSAIVFSNRCELKKITLTSNQAIVVNRYNIKEAINNIQTQSELNTTNIAAIYDKLYPYTQVSDSVKKAHIENIKTNKREP